MTNELNQLYTQTETRMKKCMDNFQHELTKLRTGRAHTSLLDHIKVSHYGNDVPLNQVGNVGVSDARTLTVTVWEKNAIQAVEKAIMTADLGLNPMTNGHVIRIPLPALTQERRTELVKLVKTETEQARVSTRNVRRESLAQIKDLLKNKLITQDDENRADSHVQKITDKIIADIDKMALIKEQELMQV